MTIFDELLSQVEDNTVEDTFESDLSSLFTDGTDTELYSEAEEEITPEKVAEMKAKAKKIKKAIKIALAVLAVIIGARIIIKSNSAEKLALQHEITKLKAEKAEIQKSSSADKSKLSELDAKIKKLEAEKKNLEKTKDKYDKTAEAKKEKEKAKAQKLAEALKAKNKEIDAMLKKDYSEVKTAGWVNAIEKLFGEAEMLIAQAHSLEKNKNKTSDAFSKLILKQNSAVDKMNKAGNKTKTGDKFSDKALNNALYLSAGVNGRANKLKPDGLKNYKFMNKNLKYVDNNGDGKFQQKDGKNGYKDVKVNLNESYAVCIDSSMYDEYANFIENATDNFIESKISFDQYCVLSSKAIEKYGDVLMNEATSVPDEYDLIMDAICEKFNNNKISVEQAVLLMEKAGDKYLDESYEEDAFEEDDFDDQLLMAAEESADYNAEYERLVDAICEKYNNNEINADDTILLLEKAVDKYSIDYSSDDLYDDTYEESSDDDDDSDYTSIFDDDDTD